MRINDIIICYSNLLCSIVINLYSIIIVTYYIVPLYNYSTIMSL